MKVHADSKYDFVKSGINSIPIISRFLVPELSRSITHIALSIVAPKTRNCFTASIIAPPEVTTSSTISRRFPLYYCVFFSLLLMKIKRSIVIFPEFGIDTNLIQNIRNNYDPLASKIAPHITIVFPFESEISSNILHQYIKNSLYEFKAFSLIMQGISQEQGNYLFLNLIQGQENIIRIHDLVYSGLLERFLSKQHCYKPHLTVGRLQNLLATEAAMNKLKYFDYKFETKVNKITSEIILDNLSSEVDFEITLPENT